MQYNPALKGGPLRGIARIVMGYPKGGIDSVKMQPTAHEELKIETPHGVIFIRTGMVDDKGRDLMIVEVTADGDRQSGVWPSWCRLRGSDKSGLRVDVFRVKTKPRKKVDS